MNPYTRDILSKTQIRCVHLWGNLSTYGGSQPDNVECEICRVTRKAWQSYVRVASENCEHKFTAENTLAINPRWDRISGRCIHCYIPFTARYDNETGRMYDLLAGPKIALSPISQGRNEALPDIDLSEPPAPVSEIAQRYVPVECPDVVGMETEKECIALTMETSIPTVFIGHTGIAKTLLIKNCHKQVGWPYHTITGHAQVEVDTLVGKIWVEQGTMHFKPGILIFCMKEGIAIGFQEINAVAPEVLIMLHEYLDEGHVTLTDLPADHPDFLIHPHPNYRLYGTMNPPDLYPGIRELSPALARRCLVRRVEPLKQDQELQVITERVPEIGVDLARSMVQTANGMRKNLEEHKASFFLSTADLVMWAQTTVRVGDVHKAADICVYGKAPREDESLLRTLIRSTIGAPRTPVTADV